MEKTPCNIIFFAPPFCHGFIHQSLLGLVWTAASADLQCFCLLQISWLQRINWKSFGGLLLCTPFATKQFMLQRNGPLDSNLMLLFTVLFVIAPEVLHSHIFWQLDNIDKSRLDKKNVQKQLSIGLFFLVSWFAVCRSRQGTFQIVNYLSISAEADDLKLRTMDDTF